MSVIVKGMEMPKDCRECRMMEYHERTGKTWCKPADGLLADTYRPIMYDGRPDWCPLVELPEHHGRLFDQDDVKAVLYDIPDAKDKWDAIALLEWAIDKRWCIEAEGVDE